MLVKVNFYGVCRDFLDSREIELEVEAEATIREMLLKLSHVLGEGFRSRVLDQDGALQQHVNLSVNDRIVGASEIDRRINPDDSPRSHVSVLFIPPMFGGV